jgi:glycerol-3-phosphate acyltransferase PlsY
MLPTVSILLSYLIGSISSACIVGWLAGKVDMREEPDGRVSASAVFHKLGLLPFLSVVIMDISLAALAVVITGLLTSSTTIMLFSGLFAVAGHNWSIFLKFKGGLGATSILGAVSVILTWYVFYGLILAGIVFFITHRTGLSTIVGILGFSGVILIQDGVGLLALFPLMLLALMFLKRYQVSRITDTAS